MAAQIPIKNDPEANEKALTKVKNDKPQLQFEIIVNARKFNDAKVLENIGGSGYTWLADVMLSIRP